jgi:hypothetical protein
MVVQKKKEIICTTWLASQCGTNSDFLKTAAAHLLKLIFNNKFFLKRID